MFHALVRSQSRCGPAVSAVVAVGDWGRGCHGGVHVTETPAGISSAPLR